MWNSAAARGSPRRSANPRGGDSLRQSDHHPQCSEPEPAPPPRGCRQGDRPPFLRPAPQGQRDPRPLLHHHRTVRQPQAARRSPPARGHRISPRASAPRPRDQSPPACGRTTPNQAAAHCPDVGCASSAAARDFRQPKTRGGSRRIRDYSVSLLDVPLDRSRHARYRAAMAQKRRDTNRDHPPVRAGCSPLVWLLFFGYVPPALLVGREATAGKRPRRPQPQRRGPRQGLGFLLSAEPSPRRPTANEEFT